MRKSFAVSFLSMASLLLVLGTAVMGLSQMFLVSRYFAQERYNTLDEVLAVADRAVESVAAAGLQLRQDDAADQRLAEAIRLIGETAGASLILLDEDGGVLLASAAQTPGAALDAEWRVWLPDEPGARQHTRGDLAGFLTEDCYVAAGLLRSGAYTFYLLACSPAKGLLGFLSEMFYNFMLSAALMLLCASLVASVLTQRIAGPLQRISEAAQRFGGGDFSTRVEVEGDDEIAQLARSFNAMADNLSAIDASRGQFMGNIAHELRTPMTTIKGFIDGILDGAIPPDLEHHYLEIVSEETGRLARLVQNMLDITKLEAGEYRARPQLFNIWDTVTRAALNAEQRITAGGIQLEGLGPDQKALAYADPDQIHQVLQNLLDNALKFTPAGGVIRFSAVSMGPEVEISVYNTGAGIAPEALPFVFERFYKEDASRGLNAKGAGLGLHICKVLVTLNGGQIRVESEQGEWCRFTFTLPATLPEGDSLPQLMPDTEETVREKAEERARARAEKKKK